MSSSILREEFKLSDEAWERHCRKTDRISNSAVRKDKSKSMLAAMMENEESYRRMTSADGVNIHDYIMAGV